MFRFKRLAQKIKNIIIFAIIIGWTFSGWPQIFNFPPKIQKAHAATVTKTWSFAADAESWTASTPAPNNTVAQWQSTDGSPANGSLEMRITGKNKSNTGRVWEIAGTWEAIFGIPAGSTVTEVGSGTGNSYTYRVSEYNVGAAGNSGPFEFYDNTPTLQGTFSAATAFSGLVAWSTKTGAAVSVPAALQASNNTVRFRITNDLATGNNNSAAVTLRQDQITLTITYTAAVYSISITPAGDISYGFVSLSNSTTTIGSTYTKTATNDGNTAEKLNVKSSDATTGTAWTLASAIGTDIFKHEFSTTTGAAWTVMPDSATYVTAVPSVAVSGTAAFDFRLTAPSSSSDYQQKSITITVQAVAP